MPSILVIVLGMFALAGAVAVFVEDKCRKGWGFLALLAPISLWGWVMAASFQPNVIESEKVYDIDTVSDGAQVVVLPEDRSKVVNLNVVLGRNIPPGSKAKRTVWQGTYWGIDFKVDNEAGSLKDRWELVKE